MMLEPRHQYERERKKKNPDPYLTLHNNSKLITNLNAKVKTMKPLVEITAKQPSNLGIGKDFLKINE